jgi:hypothetical protein
LAPVLRVLTIAAALGLSNFAAATAIGLAGVDRAVRLRVSGAIVLSDLTGPTGESNKST